MKLESAPVRLTAAPVWLVQLGSTTTVWLGSNTPLPAASTARATGVTAAAPAMARLYARLVAQENASVAPSVITKAPLWVGVPDSVAVPGLNARPAGSVPVRLTVVGLVAPLTEKTCEYGTPILPVASVSGATDRAEHATSTEPISQPLPWGRVKPRWSVGAAQDTALMTELPGRG